MRFFRLLTFALLALFAGFASCTNAHRDPVEPQLYPCDSTVSFSAQIKPILDAKCVTCHENTFANGSLLTYGGAKAKADNGQLLRVVVKQNRMPPLEGLPDSERQLIYCWLQQGALNN
jgi:hypothetical protein